MTAAEGAAFAAGIRHAADMATIAAVTLEARPDAEDMRQRAAIEALRGLADGLKDRHSLPTLEGKGVRSVNTPATSEGVGTLHPPRSNRRQAAIIAGYTGDPCPSCQGFTLKRAGTCQVCDACGSTTGCS